MKLNRTNALWDRQTRNDINENWEVLEGLAQALDSLILGESISDAEVIRARGSYPLLGNRLDAMAQNTRDNEKNLNTIDAIKANKTYVDDVIQGIASRIDAIIAEPAEGISQQEIIDARQGKASLGANLTSIKSRLATAFGNKLKNGNFAIGNLNDYTVIYGEGYVQGGKAALTGSGVGHSTFGAVLSQRVADDIPTREVWYTRARIRTLDVAASLRVGFRGTTGYINDRINNPEVGKWYDFSYYYTPDDGSGLTGIFSATAFGAYASGENNGKRTEVENFLAINLTEAFGAGNEPSKESIDLLLSVLPGSWIDEEINVADLGVANFKYMLQNEKRIDRKLELQNEQVEDAIRSDIENKIYNGDFSKTENTGWSTESGTTWTISNNTMNIIGTGTSNLPRIRQQTEMPFTPGRKIYVRADFTVTNSDCNQIGFAAFSDVAGDTIKYIVTSDFSANETKTINGIFTMDDVGSGYITLQIRTRYPSSDSANGKSVQVKNVLALDLTELFGEGNEPDRETFNNFISRFPHWFDGRMDLKTVQKALLSYIIRPSQGNTSIDLRKPMIAIEFDDGYKTDFDIAYPILRARGIKATSFIIGSKPDNDDPRYMSWDEIKQLKYEGGWDIGCHTYDHLRLADQTDEEIHRQLQLNSEAFQAQGMMVPRHFALPFGSGSLDSRVIDIVMQYRKSCRKIGAFSDSFSAYADINFSALNAKGTDIYAGNTNLIAERKAEVDQIIANRGIGIWFSHEMKYSDAQQYETLVEYWTEIIDYALEKDVQFVTMEELYRYVLDYRIFTQDESR